MPRRRRAFIVENVPDANLVFGKDRWVQWNFVPIRECIPGFNAECRILKIAVVTLDIGVKRKVEAIRQTDLHSSVQ